MACCCRRNNKRTQTSVRVFNQNNFIPSAVQVNNQAIQSVANGEEILFPQTNYNTGVSFSPRIDELGVTIVASGVYRIYFSGNISVTEAKTVSLAIALNGTELWASRVDQYVLPEGPSNVTSSTIFKVISPSAEIGVLNLGTEFNVQNAKLDIVRLGNF